MTRNDDEKFERHLLRDNLHSFLPIKCRWWMGSQASILAIKAPNCSDTMVQRTTSVIVEKWGHRCCLPKCIKRVVDSELLPWFWQPEDVDPHQFIVRMTTSVHSCHKVCKLMIGIIGPKGSLQLSRWSDSVVVMTTWGCRTTPSIHRTVATEPY